ncbi:hypothetical protein PSEUBRA_003355 [Kalmanozyma brasiliensis GHG001]|uniref:uncharacterized protein n=1 Tax=Kalmanozyma brasiliensis (strain GHG001) TaxID=1365824 RepID=UPI002867B734|nr:uncharacterized protein PSEUBRA_003355 [Kalmanozyma brasiliensis GHG001]KAF6767227.1 hypothetical protein PSEUBRA_003355 [Kalmanozyma brasiliensis GHG001]
MSSQVNQILPLQVQITQKCVRAAEDRKVIFGRIKALEESTAAWQEEVNGKLETMHAELRTGMETMLSLASKTQKPSPAKAKNEPAATSSASKGQKRASPARKKASPANAKKAKLAPAPEEACEDAPASVTPAPDSPPAKGHQDLTQEWAQKQQTRYLQQRQQLPQQTERAQHQQQEQQIRQACPQFDGAYQQQNHFQSLSQPSGSISYPSTFEEVPLQARPRTATSYTHAPHQSLTVFEMPLGH